MGRDSSCRQRPHYALVFVALVSAVPTARLEAQDPVAAGEDLSVDQARLADRYDRLELVATRLAELSAGTDPRRARLLREAISESRELEIGLRFEAVVDLLETERLTAAARNQEQLQAELQTLLTLLLKDTRDEDIESQQKRLRRYLRQVGRLIRWQKGIKARTEGGDELSNLGSAQQQLTDETGELSNEIAENEAASAPRDSSAQGTAEEEADSDKSAESDPSQPNDNDREPPDDATSEEETPSDDTPDNEASPADGSLDQESEGSQSNPSQAPDGESQPRGKGDQSSPAQPTPGQSPPAQGGGQPAGQPNQQPQQPSDRAVDQLQQAAEAMRRAQERLAEAERNEAADQQQEALAQLQQAKAELERILRQLREEEMERTLTLLAARFRRMLEAEQKIYDATLKLHAVAESERGHRQEIAAAQWSRAQSEVVRDADKALLLLREEGSSLAFPEAIEQMRDDMSEVVERLAGVLVGPITQGLEQDIIEALEESVAALEKALDDLEQQRAPPGQMPQAGQMPEPPLVDKLAELKMIRSLQLRINRRTSRYGEMIEGEQALIDDVLDALDSLADRQERVQRATRDLALGRND